MSAFVGEPFDASEGKLNTQQNCTYNREYTKKRDIFI